MASVSSRARDGCADGMVRIRDQDLGISDIRAERDRVIGGVTDILDHEITTAIKKHVCRGWCIVIEDGGHHRGLIQTECGDIR